MSSKDCDEDSNDRSSNHSFEDDDEFVVVNVEKDKDSKHSPGWSNPFSRGTQQSTKVRQVVRCDLSFAKKPTKDPSTESSLSSSTTLPGLAFKLSPAHQLILKEELLRMIFKHEESRVREDPTIAALLRETELLSFVFIFFLETFPLFKGKPILEDFEELISLLPPLSSTIERNGKTTKRDAMWKKIKAACTWIFSNMLTLEGHSTPTPSPSPSPSPSSSPSPSPSPRTSTSSSSSSSSGSEAPTPTTPRQKHEPTFMEELAVFTYALKNTSGSIFKDLFSVLRNAPTADELPSQYRTLLTNGKVLFAHHLRARLSDTELITKIQQIRRLTPVRLLKLALKLSSPGALIERVLSLFLKRVVGTPNILQQLYKASSKLSKTETLRNAAVQNVPSQRIRQKIQAYIRSRFDERTPHPSEFEADPIRRTWLILVDTSIQPILTVEEIQQLTANDYLAVRELLLHELRYKDKHTVYDFLGDSKVIELMKKIIPVVQTPLVEVLSKVDMGGFLDISFTFLGQLTQLAEEERKSQTTEEDEDDIEEEEEEEELTEEEETEGGNEEVTTPPLQSKFQSKKEADNRDFSTRYERVVGDFIDNCYKFLHTAAVNDSGTLESLVTWLVERLELIRSGAEPLDMNLVASLAFSTIPCTISSLSDPSTAATAPSLRSSSSGEEREVLFQSLVKELEAVEEYRRKKKELKEKKLKDLMKDDTGSQHVLPVAEGPTAPELKVMQMLERPFIRQVKSRLFRSGVFQLSFSTSLEKYTEKRQVLNPRERGSTH